jgi:hypothetical protein
MTIRLVVHEAICRGHDLKPLAERRNWTFSRLVAGPPDHLELADLEDTISSRNETPIVFCTLQVATRIQRWFPRLARGVYLPREFLKWSSWSAVIPSEVLLNQRAFLLPWSKIPGEIEALRTLFGEGVFIRPDSPMKPFAGFSCATDDLAREHDALSQTERPGAGELCVISPAKSIAPIERRFWLVDGKAVANAAYSWVDPLPQAGPVSSEMMQLASRLAGMLEHHDNALTADLIETEDGPRLVELNAMSTSGFYRDLEPELLLGALQEIIIDHP